MKKWSFLLAAAVLLFMSSAAASDKEGFAEGEKIPFMEITNSIQKVSTSSERGKYVVLNFWSIADTRSRIDNALLDRAIGADGKDVTLISVCMDDDDVLWNQIIKVDGLNKAAQYQVKDSRLKDIKQTFGVEQQSRSILISPEGKVLAADNDVTQILSKLNAQRS